MSEKERTFWIAIRSALLMIVAAIERYACIGKCAEKEVNAPVRQL